ncbi:MAG: hypothetical protein P8184_16835 [Calditrichia bacterium]
MKRWLGIAVLILFMLNSLFAGMQKKTKSEVNFKGFGTYSLTQTTEVTAQKKKNDSQSAFKGQGLMGKLAAKTVLRSGESSEIIDLPAMSIYKIDNQKKEYTVVPIEKLKMSAGEEEKGASGKEESTPEEKSDIRIIRSDFKVTDTGEKQTINNFASQKYIIMWVTEWENVNTKERGTDSLSTIVWTTPLTQTMKAAQEEEQQFNSEYMQKLGIETNQLQQEMLGTQWLSLLNQMNPGKQNPEFSDTKFSQEMGKINGYPVLIDGKYYSIRPQQNASGENKEEEGSESGSARKMFGGFAKKMLKKKPEEPKGPEPAFSYSTELLELKTADLSPNDFTVPATYKKK